eukprot:2069172-Alexandrium_andersonii.AAC.1
MRSQDRDCDRDHTPASPPARACTQSIEDKATRLWEVKQVFALTSVPMDLYTQKWECTQQPHKSRAAMIRILSRTPSLRGPRAHQFQV